MMRVFVSYSMEKIAYLQSLYALLAQQEIELVDRTIGFSSDVGNTLLQCDAFLAVYSDTSPHVFYELGLASARGMPIVLGLIGDMQPPLEVSGFRLARLTGEPFYDAPNLINLLQNAAGNEREAIARLPDDEVLEAVRQNLRRVDELSPYQFEQLTGALLGQLGYTVSKPDGSVDYGYDYLIAAPGSSEQIVVECKKMKPHSLVSVGAVHQVMQAMQMVGARSGMVVAATPFTAAAVALAQQYSVALVDITELLSKAPMLTGGTAGKL